MKFVPQGLTRSIAKQVFLAKKNSPHIFFAAGGAGFVGTTILAAKATLDLEPTLDDIREKLQNVKELKEMSEQIDEAYPEKDRVRDLVVTYAYAGKQLGKLYGPAILVGAVSVAALTGSHVQLVRRNAALTTALGSVTRAFHNYRQRIRDELGEKRENDIYNGVTEISEIIDGKKQLIKTVDADGYSVYAKWFDSTAEAWQPNAEMNRYRLDMECRYFNHLLQKNGYVLLNDVYDKLGIERTAIGGLMGWVYESEDGDGFIDFGIFEARNSEFLNNLNPSIRLDFNVDPSPILDKIGN